MKKSVIFAAILVTWLFIGAQSAMAAGIDIWATVNPNWNNSWNETELKGTALYTIGVGSLSEYGANVFSVIFENDIFVSIGNVTDGTAGLISPPEWTLNYYTNPNGVHQYEVALGGPDLLEQGESLPLSFWVDYALRSSNRYNQVSGIEWAWNEGGPWQQADSATNTKELLSVWLGGGNPSGGTSTVVNPETATMLLFGSGLIGLGWFGERIQKRIQRHSELDKLTELEKINCAFVHI